MPIKTHGSPVEVLQGRGEVHAVSYVPALCLSVVNAWL